MWVTTVLLAWSAAQLLPAYQNFLLRVHELLDNEPESVAASAAFLGSCYMLWTVMPAIECICPVDWRFILRLAPTVFCFSHHFDWREVELVGLHTCIDLFLLSCAGKTKPLCWLKQIRLWLAAAQ